MIERLSRHWATSGMLLVCLASLCLTPKARAAVWSLGTTTGVMQQPTSHYYHLVYGIQGGVATDSERLGTWLQYIERPEFKAGGFVDKEALVMSLVTTKLTKSKTHGLFAGFGAGYLAGYIAAENEADFAEPKRTFTIRGPAAMVEYAYRWKSIDLAVNHQTLIGYVNNDQLKAMVAWPYNFYALRLGYRW